MIPLPRPEYDAIEIADNARRTLARRSTKAAAVATQALRSYLADVIGGERGEALLDMLTGYPSGSLGECLHALGYVVTDPKPDSGAPRCHIAGRNGDRDGSFTLVRAFADPDAAYQFVTNTEQGAGCYLLHIDFEPAPEPELPEGLDLDMLAADMSKMLSRYGYDEWGLENVSDDEIRPALPAFIATCLAHAATVVPVPLCGHCDAPCVLAAHADSHANPADCRCNLHAES